MAYSPGPGGYGPGIGYGPNLSRARLMLAKRAGYLPPGQQIDPEQSPGLWARLSKNLSRDSRQAGFGNPLAWLRAGAQQGGRLPRRGMPPGQAGDPLAYAASRLAQRLGGRARPPAMAPQPDIRAILAQLLGGQEAPMEGALPGMVEGVAGMPPPPPVMGPMQNPMMRAPEEGGFEPYLGPPRGGMPPGLAPAVGRMAGRARPRPMPRGRRALRRGARMI